MVDTVRSISALLALMVPGVAAGTSVQDIRDTVVTLAPKHASVYDTTDQAIAVISTSQVITFNTSDSLDGFSHSSGELTVLETMAAVCVTLELEVDNGSGGNQFNVWLEKEPAAGGGFSPITASGEEIKIPARSRNRAWRSMVRSTRAEKAWMEDSRSRSDTGSDTGSIPMNGVSRWRSAACTKQKLIEKPSRSCACSLEVPLIMAYVHEHPSLIDKPGFNCLGDKGRIPVFF